ncbi:MAG: hypothetical protein P1V81_06200 [Planctomycetota bacterium]|nr:hypothetical protein [Planctomycetota bacterium]
MSTDPFQGYAGRGALIERVKARLVIDWRGIHGVAHWARVAANGRRLAGTTGADLGVVELFAWLHDSCRHDDGRDPDHGPRAVDFARELRGEFFDLEEARFELLAAACELHTRGQTEAEVTIATCWDADRLDLGRVGTVPDPRYLCTPPGRDPDVIQWALARSLAGHEPGR